MSLRYILLFFSISLSIAKSATNVNYKAEINVDTTISITGSKELLPLLKIWETEFIKLHPQVRFKNSLTGNSSAIYGLDMRTANIALMSRQIYPYERYGIYERSWVYPQEIEIATGSAVEINKAPAYAIFVNINNPIKHISLAELDRIFGAQRGGGWNALTWEEAVARPKSKNIRTWRQLGINGPLANLEIHTYGPANLGAGAISYFQNRVLHGGAMWNENFKEYIDLKEMMKVLASDKQGIAYAPLGYQTPETKPITVSVGESIDYYELTKSNVETHSYPLYRSIYAYYTIDDEKTMITTTFGDVQIKEFLRYILSKQGQDKIVLQGSFLPLPVAEIETQLIKLNSKQIPPEHALLE
jgi:phosphate transport system substrate-binding protein